jgi:hypothetical protein
MRLAIAWLFAACGHAHTREPDEPVLGNGLDGQDLVQLPEPCPHGATAKGHAGPGWIS